MIEKVHSFPAILFILLIKAENLLEILRAFIQRILRSDVRRRMYPIQLKGRILSA